MCFFHFYVYIVCAALVVYSINKNNKSTFKVLIETEESNVTG